MTPRAAHTRKQAPTARVTNCPPSNQSSFSRVCAALNPAAKGVGTAPQTPPSMITTPLASSVRGRSPREVWTLSPREVHHQYLDNARSSSCRCQLSVVQYLLIQLAAIPPGVGRGQRPTGRKSSTSKGRQQPSARRSAWVDSIHTTTSPTVRATRLRTSAVRSPSEGQGRCCENQAVELPPRNTAISASAAILTHADGARLRDRCHDTREKPPPPEQSTDKPTARPYARRSGHTRSKECAYHPETHDTSGQQRMLADLPGLGEHVHLHNRDAKACA
jgi:hypothetical protein